jgi:hypothetical protein
VKKPRSIPRMEVDAEGLRACCSFIWSLSLFNGEEISGCSACREISYFLVALSCVLAD